MDKVRVLVNGLKSPEGPSFDETGCLWCVEQEGEGLLCRDKDGSLMRIHTGGRPSGGVIRGSYLWFSDSGQNAIRRMHIDTKKIETVVDEIGGVPLNMPNDLIFDGQGNLIFSCPGLPDDEAMGYVAVYTTQGVAQVIADGLLYPNGLALFPTTKTLLIAETHRQRIWEGFWDDQSLSWETIRVWSQVNDAPANTHTPGPYGLAVGPDGCLYVAVFGAGLIRVFSADGYPIRDIELPGKNPTNCIFDPSGNLGLVVTESERGELLSITL
jgi:gluconolactonase